MKCIIWAGVDLVPDVFLNFSDEFWCFNGELLDLDLTTVVINTHNLMGWDVFYMISSPFGHVLTHRFSLFLLYIIHASMGSSEYLSSHE